MRWPRNKLGALFKLTGYERAFSVLLSHSLGGGGAHCGRVGIGKGLSRSSEGRDGILVSVLKRSGSPASAGWNQCNSHVSFPTPDQQFSVILLDS